VQIPKSSAAVAVLLSFCSFSACSSSTAETHGGKAGAGSPSDGLIFTAGGFSSGGDSDAAAGSGGRGGGVPNARGNAGANGVVAPAEPGACTPPPDDSGCVGQAYAGETIPLDIYVMFDQSGSMSNIEQGGITRMDAVRDAMAAFLQDRASAGLSVGIGYFGQEPIGQTTCNPADYAQADVPIGGLPGNAGAIEDSLARRSPTGETPSGSAIRGACTYVQQWQTDHPGREVVLLLVTDGLPEAPVTCSNGNTSCCPTLDDAVQATADCHTGATGVKTFVLGVGPYLDNLAQIAVAGGTDKAYLVSGGDVSKQVLAALNAIRLAAQVPCVLSIPMPPMGHSLDYTRVNLLRTSVDCQTTTIPYLETYASCDSSGGWYFDSTSSPTQIILCKATCDDVSVPGTALEYSIGCDRTGLR
jgi:Mg-chelatase subunit ChlD